MGSFLPPVADEVPPAFPPGSPEWNANPLGNRLHRHLGAGPRGRNVWILDGSTVTESAPVTTYNDDGSIDQLPVERITREFLGGHTAYEVNAAEEAFLEAAGYTVT